MTDLEGTIKTLINQAVDAELGGRRSTPPLNLTAGINVPPVAGPVAQWRLPLLAASVASLLTAGATLAITGSRHENTSRPSSTAAAPIIARPTHDRTGSDRTPAVVYPEATDVRGVTVGPVPAKAATDDDGTVEPLEGDAPISPAPDGSYTLHARVVSPLGDRRPTSVVSLTVDNVSSAQCPPPFLSRAGHSYLLSCSVIALPRLDPKVALKLAEASESTTAAWTVKLRRAG